MATPGPSGITLQFRPLPASAALRTGMMLQTEIRGASDAPFLTLAGQRVPLEPNQVLPPGQAVRVEVLATAPRLQLRIVPLIETASPPSPDATQSLDALLAPVLRALGAADAARVAPVLLPARMPLTQEQVTRVLALFLQQSRLGEDLGLLTQLVSQAARAGVLLPEAAAQFSAQAGLLSAQTAADFRQLLESAGTNARTEARLAQLIAAGTLEDVLGALRAELRSLVASLRGNQALLTWLRGNRQLRQFEDAAHRITERLAGQDLQQLRGLEQAYQFIELPLVSDGGLRQAQLHFFDESGPEGQGGASRRRGTVVLDLETERLGPLWVALRMVGRQCQCHFRTTNPAVLEAIEAARDELAGALLDAGFEHAEVRAFDWSGNRLRALAMLMDRFAGIDVGT